VNGKFLAFVPVHQVGFDMLYCKIARGLRYLFCKFIYLEVHNDKQSFELVAIFRGVEIVCKDIGISQKTNKR
jgi:hypothetical protein